MTTNEMTEKNSIVGLMKIDNISDIVEANFGNESGGLTAQDLERVPLPRHPSATWLIPEVDGGECREETLNGILIGSQKNRVYWSKNYTEAGGGTPPDCFAIHNIGQGNPGGNCFECPLNVFGSAIIGAGKACKEIETLFLLVEGKLLPVIVNISPTSLKALRQYRTRLTSAQIKITDVVTSISVRETSNAKGLKYNRAVLKVSRKLNASEIKQVAEYKRLFDKLCIQQPIMMIDQEEIS